MEVDEYVEGILACKRTVLGQAITLVESSLPEHNVIAQQIIEKCLPHSGNSIRIGITGVPGVGKSTFIEATGTYLTGMGHKLAVLAIDPSSQRSKGSILGDKTRMEKLSTDPDAFIRPSPTAGTLGGVARKTLETIILCEAAGFNVIFVETVGVGQSETAVHSMVDFFMLLMLAGAGDELQGIKKGIMEMADAIVINKADGDNMQKALQAKKEYENALHLFPPNESGWYPKVTTCSSITKEGIEEIWEIVRDYRDNMIKNGHFEKRRQKQVQMSMLSSIEEQLMSDFKTDPVIRKLLPEFKQKLLENRISAYAAAQELLEIYFNAKTGSSRNHNAR
jgi:LAO/AO transport system kinase